MMAALKLRRRPEPAEAAPPEDRPQLEETPVMTGLRKLMEMAEMNGLKAAADALIEDPTLLGLAQAIVEADTSAAAKLWEGAHSCRTYSPTVYAKCMEAMGLIAFAHSSEYFRDRTDWNNPPPDDFRITEYVHKSGKRLPVIVAPVVDQYRKIVACVLLYVKKDWSGWADVTPRTQVVGRVDGLMLRFQRAGNILAVAPSFETAAAASLEFRGQALWIALSPENMAECFTPPTEVRSLYLLHTTKAERAAAARAAERIDAEHMVNITLLNPLTEKAEAYPFE